jgi:hypothetical protein
VQYVELALELGIKPDRINTIANYAANFDRFTGQVRRLTAGLSDPSQKTWKLVQADERSVVFMRQPPPGVTPLNNLEALRSVELQCEQQVLHDPRYPRCARGLSDIYAIIGDLGRARQWMAYYMNHKAEADPDSDRAWQSLQASPR